MKRKRSDAPCYAAFAYYYDAYMSACDLQEWRTYLCAAEERYAACAKGRVLDLGCGTGNFALPYARAGRAVTGVDLSCDMLSAADEKAYGEGLRLKLLCCDMSAFTAQETFSFAYSACDSVNYLDATRLSAFFEHVYGMLEGGGVLAFDFISAQARTAGRERHRLAENIYWNFAAAAAGMFLRRIFSYMTAQRLFLKHTGNISTRRRKLSKARGGPALTYAACSI
jgi:SAM-dependent methyltransferase